MDIACGKCGHVLFEDKLAKTIDAKGPNLTAAAPDLLAALKRLDAAFEQRSYPELQGIWTDAVQAIARAEGR